MVEKLKTRIVEIGCGLSFLLILTGWAWAYFTLKNIGQPLIIKFVHFGGYSEITQIGNFWDVTSIAILGLIVTSINFLIAMKLEKRDWFYGKFVAAATFLFGFLIFVAFAVIINVN